MSQHFNPPCERSRARRLSAVLCSTRGSASSSCCAARAAQTACSVVYTISPQNSGAFGGSITINNTGTTAWTQLDADLDLRQRPDDFVILERCGNPERRERDGDERNLQRPHPRRGQHKWIGLQRHLEWQLRTQYPHRLPSTEIPAAAPRRAALRLPLRRPHCPLLRAPAPPTPSR